MYEPSRGDRPTGAEAGEFVDVPETMPGDHDDPHPAIRSDEGVVTTVTRPDARDARLRVYLNDHRSGAAVGLAVARRCLGRNRGSMLGSELERIVADLQADAASLDEVMRGLAVTPDRVKRALAWAGERVGRLKLNGQLSGYSPLSRQLELEMLLAGIDAKRSLWRALASARVAAPDTVDYGTLIDRATDQRCRLVPHHERAAKDALATGAR
jgi:hypothetical protein